MATKAETIIQQRIIKELSNYCLVIRNNVGKYKTIDNRFISIGQKGMPDLLCVLPHGAVVWLEIKTPSGKLSQDQVEYHIKLRHYGHTVAVVHSVPEALEAIGIQTLF